MGAAGELGKIEGVTVEAHHRGVAFIRLLPLHQAVLQDEETRAIAVDQFALLREQGHPLLRIALIVDHDAQQITVRPALPQTDGHAIAQGHETSGLQDVRDDVGADFREPIAQHAQALGREIRADNSHQQRHDDCNVQKRTEELRRRNACRVHHDDLGVGAQLVEHVRDRDQQRDRRDHQDQQRNDQTGDADEHQDRLTLGGHDVEVAQCLGDPDHGGEADQHDEKGAEGRAENVSANRSHPRRVPRPGDQPACHPAPPPDMRHV